MQRPIQRLAMTTRAVSIRRAHDAVWLRGRHDARNMTHLLPILAIIFTATVFRSAFGFGESLVGVPLLALFVPVELAVPLSVLVSVTIAAFVLIQDHANVHVRTARNLIGYAALGIPIGLLFLTRIDESIVKLALGIAIMVFALYVLTGRRLAELTEDHHGWLFVCGFASGVLGGAYGLNGPPLVIYGSKRRWNAQQFRATLQAYFLAASLVGLIGYAASGLVTRQMLGYFVSSLPVVVPAILLGRWLNSRMTDGAFFRYAYALLLLVGAVIIADSQR